MRRDGVVCKVLAKSGGAAVESGASYKSRDRTLNKCVQHASSDGPVGVELAGMHVLRTSLDERDCEVADASVPAQIVTFCP